MPPATRTKPATPAPAPAASPAGRASSPPHVALARSDPASAHPATLPRRARTARRARQPSEARLSLAAAAVARRAAAVVGVFGRVRRVPPRMDSLIEYLSSWGGTDKALMLSQYSARLLVALAALQHRARTWLGLSLSPAPSALDTLAHHPPYGGSHTAHRFAALSDACADARTLFRIWSVLPIIRWVRAILPLLWPLSAPDPAILRLHACACCMYSLGPVARPAC